MGTSKFGFWRNRISSLPMCYYSVISDYNTVLCKGVDGGEPWGSKLSPLAKKIRFFRNYVRQITGEGCKELRRTDKKMFRLPPYNGVIYILGTLWTKRFLCHKYSVDICLQVQRRNIAKIYNMEQRRVIVPNCIFFFSKTMGTNLRNSSVQVFLVEILYWYDIVFHLL